MGKLLRGKSSGLKGKIKDSNNRPKTLKKKYRYYRRLTKKVFESSQQRNLQLKTASNNYVPFYPNSSARHFPRYFTSFYLEQDPSIDAVESNIVQNPTIIDKPGCYLLNNPMIIYATILLSNLFLIKDMSRTLLLLIPAVLLLTAECTTLNEDITNTLKALLEERQLKGMQVQVTKQQEIIYNLNLGVKNEAGEPIDNNTMFRIASVSKSFSSVAIMQLVEQNKLRLNQSLTELFGYKI